MKSGRYNKRLIVVSMCIEAILAIIILKFYILSSNPQYSKMASNTHSSSIKISNGEGMIYDRNFNSLVNETTKYICVAVPYKTNVDELLKYAEIPEEVIDGMKSTIPFMFKSNAYIPESEGVYSFQVPVRYGENQVAQHLIGYTSQGEGVSGLEYSYDKILRQDNNEHIIKYNVDGFGNLLNGVSISVDRLSIGLSGLVTTIDKDIQQICENICKDVEAGAVVVTEVKTGDIIAMLSMPTYSLSTLATDIQNENSPMINRVLYSYNVGSIFKLITACEGIKEGYEDFEYNCTGSIDVDGRIYNCHNLNGHENQTLEVAMTNSCNTYFIAMSQNFDITEYRNLAFELGFGRENHLASGIIGSAGVLPTEKELSLSGELANFSFGQGKLTATPLQISQLTCAIANGGQMPVLRVVKGFTDDRITVENEKSPKYFYTMDREMAFKLQYLMSSAINKNESSNAKASNTTVAGKTSTAQTGQYNENGDEINNAWITGYFPIESPKYAVTVLVEDGGYGNDSAAPLFKKIVEEIVEFEKNN